MSIQMIVASTIDGVIGSNNALPWKLRADMQNFRKVTTGSVVIMGRATFESMGSKPLPNRENIVVTSKAYLPKGFYVANSIPEALSLSRDKFPDKDIFVIGGASIYSQMVDLVDTLHITTIYSDIDGDTYLEPIKCQDWDVISRHLVCVDDVNSHPHIIEVRERLRHAQ